MTQDALPALDACIRLYATVHDRFGTDPVAPDRIEALDPDGDDNGGGADRPLAARLDLLVAYGLFDRTGDGRYRVRCPPDASPDRWRERYEERAETLRRRVTRERGTDRIAHEGTAYRGVRVPDGASLESVAAEIAERSPGAESDATGVVLRSSPEFADRVQRMADDLTDPSGAGGDLPADYEKEGTDLVGNHKDSLEFRLFLRAT